MSKRAASLWEIKALIARQEAALKPGQFSRLDVEVLRTMSESVGVLPSNNNHVTKHFCALLIRVADHLEKSGAVVEALNKGETK